MLKQERWKGPDPTEKFHRRFEETLEELQNKQEKKPKRVFRRITAGLGAAAAGILIFAGICKANPVWASKLPVIREIFNLVEDQASFPGEYTSYAEPEKEEKIAEDQGISIQVSETYCNGTALYLSFTMESQQEFQETMKDKNGNPILTLYTELQLEGQDMTMLPLVPDGKFIDKKHYAGMLRIDLQDIPGGEKTGNQFQLDFRVIEIRGDLETPEALAAGYAQEKWRREGSWRIDLDFHVNKEDVKQIEIQETNPEGIGIESISITPFEITVKEKYAREEQEMNSFLVILDANGEIMENSKSGNINSAAIGDHDISVVYLYICDYRTYVDELKPGYYNQEMSAQEFKALLEENALFRKEISAEP